MVFWVNKLCHFIYRCQVHEIASVDCNVSAKLFVGAEVPSTHVTLVFKIINHQTSIMNNLCNARSIINIFVRFEILQV